MLNLIVEKLIKHLIVARLSAPLTAAHILAVGYRTEIATACYLATFGLEYIGILDNANADKARLLLAGTGLVTMADKITRYAPLANSLILEAKRLEEERKKNAPPSGH